MAKLTDNALRIMTYVGTALLAIFVGYTVYSSLDQFRREPTFATLLVAAGMVGLLLIVITTAIQRSRS